MGLMLSHKDWDLEIMQEVLVLMRRSLPILPVPCRCEKSTQVSVPGLPPLPSVPFGSELPDRSGVYFAVGSYGEFLYIGHAKSFKHRWKRHHKREELKQYQNVRIAWYETEDRICLERKLIVELRPLLNQAMPSLKQ